MNHEESVKILQMVAGGYPNFRPADMKTTIAFWESVLEDYDFLDVSLALKTYAASNATGFAPSPGQLIEIMQKVRSAGAGQMTDNEAWDLVRKALSNSAYNAAHEFHKLPEMIQRAVGSASVLQSWALDDNFNESVISSQFLKCYRIEQNRALEEDRFPEAVKAIINATKQKSLELTEARAALIAAGVEFPVVEEDTDPLPIREDDDGYQFLNLDEYRRQRDAKKDELPADGKTVADLVQSFKDAMKQGD